MTFLLVVIIILEVANIVIFDVFKHENDEKWESQIGINKEQHGFNDDAIKFSKRAAIEIGKLK